MKPKLALITLSLISGLISCNKSGENLQENDVFNVSFDNCKTSIDLKLSDIIEDARLIPLETTEECFIDINPRVVIGEDYILVLDRNGIYKFSHEGRFLKKLVNAGRGPQELASTGRYRFCENENILVFDDRRGNPDVFKVYDIENEQFMNPVKRCYPERNTGLFTVPDDSLIMWSPSSISRDTSRYALFLQNFKGEIVAEISSSRNIYDPNGKEERVQRLLIYPGDKGTYVRYVYDDTLFRYEDNHLFPYVVVSFNESRNYIRNTGMDIGERRVNFMQTENSVFMIVEEIIFQGITKTEGGQRANYKYNNFYLNKSNGSFAQIKSYTDDITGEVQEAIGNRLILPTNLPGGKIYVLYRTIDLIGKDFAGIPDSDLPPDLVKQLQEIQQNLNEMDNPVLLIGTVKKKI